MQEVRQKRLGPTNRMQAPLVSKQDTKRSDVFRFVGGLRQRWEYRSAGDTVYYITDCGVDRLQTKLMCE